MLKVYSEPEPQMKEMEPSASDLQSAFEQLCGVDGQFSADLLLAKLHETKTALFSGTNSSHFPLSGPVRRRCALRPHRCSLYACALSGDRNADVDEYLTGLGVSSQSFTAQQWSSLLQTTPAYAYSPLLVRWLFAASFARFDPTVLSLFFVAFAV